MSPLLLLLVCILLVRISCFSFPSPPRSSSRIFLGFDDIIDDDEDLLEQLRSQLQFSNEATQRPSGSSNPREISNSIKAFFISRVKTPEYTARFRQYLIDNKDSLDIVNSIAIVDGCARIGMSSSDIISWSILEEAMGKFNFMVSSSIICKAFSALSSLRLDEARTKKYLKMLWAAVDYSKVSLTPSESCNCLYQLQSIKVSSYCASLNRFLDFFSLSLSSVKTPLTPKTVCSAIYGLRRLKPTRELRKVLTSLTMKVNDCEMYYHSVNVCIALNGLQGMDDSLYEVRELLSALMDKAVVAEEQGAQYCKDREISMALFGLQRMGVHRDIYNFHAGPASSAIGAQKVSPELKRVVRYITSLLVYYKGPFEAKRLGLAMMGMIGLPADLVEVEELTSELALKAADAVGRMSSQEMSMCIHGLVHCRPDKEASRKLMLALVPLMRACSDMTSMDVSSAMLGLQSMRLSTDKSIEKMNGQPWKASASRDLQLFVTSFSDMVMRSNAVFDTVHDASRAMYGIHSLSADPQLFHSLKAQIPRMLSGVEVYRMDTVKESMDESFKSKFISRKKRYDGRDIAVLLYSLRSSSSADDSTRKVLASVAEICNSITLRDYEASKSGDPVICMRGIDVAAIIFGFQQLRSDVSEVQSLIQAVAPLLYQCEGTVDSKGIFMIFNGLQGMRSKDVGVKLLLKSIEPLLSRSMGCFNGFTDFYQLSGAISGLSRLNPKDPSSAKMITIFSRLVAINTAKTTGAEKAKFLSRCTPDRVGLALFGLQGFESGDENLKVILEALLPYMGKLASLDGKVVGMCFQGFRSSAGTPSNEQLQILSMLNLRMSGWSFRGRKSVTNPRQASKFLRDAQITLRSSLSGLKRLDRNNPVVKSILINFSEEVLLWEEVMNTATAGEGNFEYRDVFDMRTKRIMRDIFADLEDDKNVHKVLAMFSKDSKVIKKIVERI